MAVLVALPTVRWVYNSVGQFRNEAWPASWNWHLATAITPAVLKTVVTLSEVTQSSGGGYSSSGQALAQNSTDFPVWGWYDGVNQLGPFDGGYIDIKPLTQAAVAGSIDWRYWLLADANVTVGSREIYAVADAGQLETIFSETTHHFTVRIRLKA